MKVSDETVEQGLDCYDPETRVFPEIRTKLSKGEGLSKRDALLILKWKLGRIKGSNAETISAVNLKKINEAIVDANTTDGAVDALKALRSSMNGCWRVWIYSRSGMKRRRGRKTKRRNTARTIGPRKSTSMNIYQR